MEQAPFRVDLRLQLLSLLGAQGQLGRARTETDRYVESIQALPDAGPSGQTAVAAVEFAMGYLEGEFDGILAQMQHEPEGHYGRYQCYLEMGRNDDAAAELDATGDTASGYDLLNLSVAYRLQGDEAKAARWHDRAYARFAAGSQDERQLAALLSRGGGVSLADIDNVTLEPKRQPIALVALAQQSPEARAGLLERAERLNYSRMFPYRFLQRAIAASRGPQP
jgi:hypothetical protein